MSNTNPESVLRRVINSFPGHVFWKDLKGIYLGCNTQHAKSAGLESSDDIIGKTDYDLLWKDRADKIISHDKIVLDEKRIISVEEPIILPGNKDISVFLSKKMPFYDENGEISGIIGISQDVSELKKAKVDLQKTLDKQESILARYKQFVDDQEHDIRTPVGGVVAGMELLLDMLKDIPDDAREIMSLIHSSAKEILDYQESIIHDLYAGTRPGVTIFSRFNLSDITSRIYSINLTTAKLKGLIFTYTYDTSIPKYLIGDGKQIYQCLLDLVSNAIRFTKKGSVNINIVCVNNENDKVIVRFEVKDTGVGIPENKQREIYEAFVKINPSNKGGERGRGLGLTRVNAIAKLQKGDLWFTSTLGEGSCFNLAIPFSIAVDQFAP